MNIAGEQILRLPSLPVPPQNEVAMEGTLRYGAVALFPDRALASDPRFALTDENASAVAEIARRLDGIPLALELAAARVRLLSPQQLAQKLDERFRVLTGGDRSALPRQQTLRATIDWSFDLLDERERRLLRRLSIFAGGWTLRSATAVCGEEHIADELEMLDALSSLADKSLVVVEPSGDDRRYRMLHSMREYGLEQLAEAGESGGSPGVTRSTIRLFVRELAPLALALEDAEWQRSLAPEIDNLRAAIAWSVFEGSAPEIGLPLLADLEWPELLTTPNEALRWYESALERVAAMPDPLVHARLLRHRVMLEWLAGRPLAERQHTALRAVDVARLQRSRRNRSRAGEPRGHLPFRWAVRRSRPGAREAFERPERLSPITPNAVLRVWAVTDLQRGDVELARRRFSEVARLERAGSDAHASALLNLGELEFAAGNTNAAREAAWAKETYARLNSVYLVLVLRISRRTR